MYDITDPAAVTREVQRCLLEVSYATDGLPHIAVDGIFGEETEHALRLFQEQNGLDITGAADAATWEELSFQSMTAQAAREGGTPTLLPPWVLPLSLHDEGNEVWILQHMLLALCEEMPGARAPVPNGRYDHATRNAVRTFQEGRSLPPSGIVDEETWEAMVLDYGQRKPTPCRD